MDTNREDLETLVCPLRGRLPTNGTAEGTVLRAGGRGFTGLVNPFSLAG